MWALRFICFPWSDDQETPSPRHTHTYTHTLRRTLQLRTEHWASQTFTVGLSGGLDWPLGGLSAWLDWPLAWTDPWLGLSAGLAWIVNQTIVETRKNEIGKLKKKLNTMLVISECYASQGASTQNFRTLKAHLLKKFVRNTFVIWNGHYKVISNF